MWPPGTLDFLRELEANNFRDVRGALYRTAAGAGFPDAPADASVSLGFPAPTRNRLSGEKLEESETPWA
jgi:hypothetical protein